jgi:hypothetical protein
MRQAAVGAAIEADGGDQGGEGEEEQPGQAFQAAEDNPAAPQAAESQEHQKATDGRNRGDHGEDRTASTTIHGGAHRTPPGRPMSGNGTPPAPPFVLPYAPLTAFCLEKLKGTAAKFATYTFVGTRYRP